MTCTVALAQQSVAEANPEANWEAIRRNASAAHSSGAALLVLPELVLDGAADGPGPTLTEADDRRQALCRIASAAQLDMVVGSVREPVAGGWQSVCHYIGAGGILGSHAKSQLWWGERDQVIPGSGLPVVVAGRAGPVGLAVCWELTHAAAIAALADAGAQLVVAGGYWPTQVEGPESRHNRAIESHVIDALCLTRAFENNVGVAFCNAAGDAPPRGGHDRILVGHSQLCMPLQGSVACARDNEDSLVLAEFDPSLLVEAQAVYGLGRTPRTTFAGS